MFLCFAAFEGHVAVFPPFSGDARLKVGARAPGSKGSLRFPLDRPIPYALIGRIAKARMEQVAAKAAAKKSTKDQGRRDGRPARPRGVR